MKVLVGCETSGMVREAFLARGHDAWSCDVLPADTPTNRHIRADIRDVMMWDDWDLMTVMHPPCTRLCLSGVRWLKEPPGNPPADCTPEEAEIWPTLSREDKLAMIWRHLDAGAELFSACWNVKHISHVAVENPLMHPYARERIPNLVKPQIVQPWWFGEPCVKATGFYQRNLPQLAATNRLIPPKKDTPEYRKWSAVLLTRPGKDRWKIRSKTFPGIANALADR